MRAICTKVNEETIIKMIDWLNRNTEMVLVFTSVDYNYLWVEGDTVFGKHIRPNFAKLVTPNEFKRRVKAACGKGE